MASLTGTLETVNSGKPVTEGKKVASSFIGGLSDWATKAVSVAAPAIAQAGSDRLKSNVTKTMFDTILGPGGADELKAVQDAESQGSVPVGTSNTRIEAAARTALKNHPGREFEVVKVFSDLGMTPAILQNFNFQMAQEAAGQKGVIYNTETALKAASDAGFDVQPNNLAEAEAYGLRALIAENDYKRALDFARASSGGGSSTGNTSASKTTAQLVSSTALSAWYTRSEPILVTARAMVISAGDDAQQQAMMVKLRPQLYAAMEAEFRNIQGSMSAAGIMDADALKDVQTRFDADRKAIDDLFNASFVQNEQTLKILQDGFALDSRTALSTYSLLKEVVGQPTVNSIFQGDFLSSLPAETRQNFTQELNAFAKTTTMVGLNAKAAGAMHMTNLIKIWKGETKLSELTSSDAQKRLMGPLISGTINMARTIKGGGGDESTRKAFLNGSQEITTAASFLEISNDPKQQTYIRNATNSVAHPEIAETLKVLKRDNPTDPVVSAQINASRVTTAKMIKVTYGSGPNQTKDGIWSVEQGKDGKYYTQRHDAAYYKAFDQAQREVMQNNMEGGDLTLEDLIPLIQKPPADMVTKVDNLNLQVGFLVRTHELDDEGFKGVTPVELRLFYGHKDIVPTSAEGKKRTTASQDWMANYMTFQRQLQEPPKPIELTAPQATQAPTSFKGAKVSVGDLVSRFRSYGVPDVVAAGIIGNIDAESSFDPNAVNPNGGARGLIQWLSKDRLANAKNNGFDLNNVDDQIAFIVWELNNSENEAKKKIMLAKTPEEAANLVGKWYVRPERMPDGDIIHGDRRRGTASKAYAGMQ